MEIKKCQRCERQPRIQGERYCGRCKGAVLAAIRQENDHGKVRTCTEAGTRNNRAISTHQPDSGEGDFREDL